MAPGFGIAAAVVTVVVLLLSICVALVSKVLQVAKVLPPVERVSSDPLN